MLDSILFVALPYVALIVFLVGSIYRYKQRGFQVSSLSSQFLEGRTLFFGSQFFHWGVIFLFLGHLIGFLFPSAVIAWNGSPWRMIIIEWSAFGFALCMLFGLAVLIYRRMTNKRVQVVTNKMDIVVYILLIVQVISGLAVAYYGQWGSSWFASVMTPYLRSIFTFSPNPELVATLTTSNDMLDLMIQIHVVNAFIIIGMIPFTRFVHFLVAPIDYIWRPYQLVYWYWNRKSIRTSRNYFPGKPFKNN